MDEQKPQSEVECLRAELIEHWEYGNKIPRVFSESLAAFESAIRAESAAEMMGLRQIIKLASFERKALRDISAKWAEIFSEKEINATTNNE